MQRPSRALILLGCVIPRWRAARLLSHPTRAARAGTPLLGYCISRFQREDHSRQLINLNRRVASFDLSLADENRFRRVLADRIPDFIRDQ